MEKGLETPVCSNAWLVNSGILPLGTFRGAINLKLTACNIDLALGKFIRDFASKIKIGRGHEAY
jgi:hypothetical protein